jgi:hypothetical protein
MYLTRARILPLCYEDPFFKNSWLAAGPASPSLTDAASYQRKVVTNGDVTARLAVSAAGPSWARGSGNGGSPPVPSSFRQMPISSGK